MSRFEMGAIVSLSYRLHSGFSEGLDVPLADSETFSYLSRGGAPMAVKISISITD